jgi:hypothetical protein
MTTPALSPRHDALLRVVLAATQPVQPGALEQALPVSRPTINRALRELLAWGFVQKLGDGRSTRYVATDAARAALGALPYTAPTAEHGLMQWSPAALPLIESLRAPLGTRTPAGYESSFVGSYIPNQSSLLPLQLATELFNAGRSRDQLPAGTCAREVLEQLLIDLSWSSSRLEGNNKSLLDTKALFELGEQAAPFDEDTLMDQQPGTARSLQALRRFGVQLALDSFGTGVSSLTALRSCEADVLKLDGTVARLLGTSGDDDGPINNNKKN